MVQSLIIIAICGKRMTGKDKLAEILKGILINNGKRVAVQSLAYCFKRIFAQRYGLDFLRLLTERHYKEENRRLMNAAFEEFYAADPELCCREAIRSIDSDIEILIISDVRLEKDLALLHRSCFRFLSVHLAASQEVKSSFGWIYDPLVDQHWTEVDFDDQLGWLFTISICNNGTLDQLTRDAESILPWLK